MSGINMHIPPPSVTGTAVPGNLAVGDGELANYRRLQAIRREAQDGLNTDYNKTFTPKKNKARLKTALKIAAGTLATWGLWALGKKFFKHPITPPTP